MYYRFLYNYEDSPIAFDSKGFLITLPSAHHRANFNISAHGVSASLN